MVVIEIPRTYPLKPIDLHVVHPSARVEPCARAPYRLDHPESPLAEYTT
jgi:hypothetical protein